MVHFITDNISNSLAWHTSPHGVNLDHLSKFISATILQKITSIFTSYQLLDMNTPGIIYQYIT